MEWSIFLLWVNHVLALIWIVLLALVLYSNNESIEAVSTLGMHVFLACWLATDIMIHDMHHTENSMIRTTRFISTKRGIRERSLFEQFYESYLTLIGAHCFHGFYDKCPSKPPTKLGLIYNTIMRDHHVIWLEKVSSDSDYYYQDWMRGNIMH